jgi:hypothetical protein
MAFFAISWFVHVKVHTRFCGFRVGTIVNLTFHVATAIVGLILFRFCFVIIKMYCKNFTRSGRTCRHCLLSQQP